jgi:hypothetical protein
MFDVPSLYLIGRGYWSFSGLSGVVKFRIIAVNQIDRSLLSFLARGNCPSARRLSRMSLKA